MIFICPASVPAGGSFNASKSKVDSNYLSVVEQSGIKAGDGGFDVQVQGDRRTDVAGPSRPSAIAHVCEQ